MSADSVLVLTRSNTKPSDEAPRHMTLVRETGQCGRVCNGMVFGKESPGPLEAKLNEIGVRRYAGLAGECTQELEPAQAGNRR